MSGSGLATVMFTDLVGSTRQRGVVGDDIADAIVAEHDRIVSEAANACDGRVVKTLGDGALLVFSSAIEAVTAGRNIQDDVAGYNATVDGDRALSVRIGIHAGEVVTVDGDLSGLPVAIASRVCGVAAGGQIVVTSVVRSLIGRRGDVPLRSIGLHDLKGVPDPEEIWLVTDDSAQPTPTRAVIPYPAFLERGVPPGLVGRDDDMHHLDDVYAGSATGGARLVAVIGEPGIGKTALTATWTKAASDEGVTVVGGRCTPDGALPYQPFIEIARAVLAAQPERLSHLGSAAGNVARLVPDVAAPANLPPPVQGDPDTVQYLMAEAFVALLRPSDGEKPMIAVIDDIHWADEASISVLAHISRYEGDLPLLMVATYRDTDLVRSHPLPRLLADLRRSSRIERITLDPLTTDEVADMISVRIGETVSGDVAESISVETRGNPFFVTEVTAHLRDEGAIDENGQWVSDVPIGEYGIPEGVRDVVGRRLERLGEDAMTLLQVAAVIGPSFDIDIAGAAAGLGGVPLDDVVDAAMEAAILAEGDTPSEATFSHALVRQTLYDDLPIRRRVRLHRAVAQALEESGASAAEVLPHWLTAGVSDRALVAAVNAAHHARMASSEREAMQDFELAIELWDDVDDPKALTATTRARLVYQLTTLYFDFSIEREKATSLLDAQIERGVDDPGTLALLYATKARHLWLAGDIESAIELEQLALKTVPEQPPSQENAEVLAQYAGRLMTSGRYHEAVTAGLAAAEVLTFVRSTRAETIVATALGTAYGALGDLTESERWFDRLSELAKETGWLRAHLLGFTNQGEVYLFNGLYDDAIKSFLKGVERSEELGADRWRTVLLAGAADTEIVAGLWDEALAHLDQASEHPELDHSELKLIGLRLLIAVERGEEDAYAGAVSRLSKYDIANQEPPVNGPIWTAMISRHRWRGELVDAYDLAANALTSYADIEPWAEPAYIAALAIEVVADAVEGGISKDAWLDAASTWNDQLQRSDAPAPYVDIYKAFATADLSRARSMNDPELWRTAVAEADRRPYLSARAKVRLADALDPADSVRGDLLKQATATATDLGAEPLLARITAVEQA